MASHNLQSQLKIFTILLTLPFLIAQPPPETPPSSPTPPSSICKSTRYPSFCNSILPSNNSSSTVYDYGRFSVRRSLSTAKKFLSLIEKHLRNSKSLTITAVRALQDCKVLAESNIDYLTSTFQTVDKTSQILTSSKADDIQTLLSGILTNTQTCIDGIQETASAWSLRKDILTPLGNDTRLFSVSLALVTRGWVPKSRRQSRRGHKKHLKLGNGNLNLKMSEKNREIYRSVNNRKMLQIDDGSDQVLVNDIVIVSQDGSGNFTTINDAITAAPSKLNGTTGYFLVYITAGVYEEYVSILKDKRYIMMLGDGINQTILTGNRSVIDGWSTFNCSTFTVAATGFVATGITFRNTAGAIKHQAVAVRNSADLSTFSNCSFEAYQDTLYVHSLRQFYRDCDVYGTVDFIFGNAAVVFQNCNIYPRLPMRNQFNAITAQGRTDPYQNTGISFQNCTIRASADLANSNISIRTYLGRPWKEYSRTVYMQSYMDSVVDPTGWSIWSGDFALNTSYYAEFNNTGPGSDTSGRVNWPGFHVINAVNATNFTVSAFLLGDDWIYQTGVQYFGGL